MRDNNVKRRDFLAGVFAGTAVTAGTSLLWHSLPSRKTPDVVSSLKDPVLPDIYANLDMQQNIDAVSEQVFGDIYQHGSYEDGVASLNNPEPFADNEQPTAQAGSSLEKVRNFNQNFVDDIYLPESHRQILELALGRMGRVQKLVGHGNFNLISFDDMVKYGGRYSKVGAFSKQEKDFMEQIFVTNARHYGFNGEKVTEKLTEKVLRKNTYKVPYSGHYVFKGDALKHYKKLRKDVGENIILTSGIRSNVKQMYLFLSKTKSVNFNLSRASRSLAPPGHSYHGIGDYDVGRIGWGHKNFTNDFAQTDEFKRMEDLGYVQIRYTRDNNYGVRFEPWHIKVV